MAKDEYTDVLNSEFMEDEEDTQRDRYLTFRIGEEDYGIEIRHVTEIVGMQRITEVPDMPDYIKGVMNLRGNVIPVMDIRVRFKMKPRDYDDRTCIIVVHFDDTIAGLVVDTVNEVVDIPSNDVSLPPKISQGESNRYILGMGRMGEDVKILLDIGKLLYDSHLEEVAATE